MCARGPGPARGVARFALGHSLRWGAAVSAGVSDVLSSGQNVSGALASRKRGGVTAAENLRLCGLVLLGGCTLRSGVPRGTSGTVLYHECVCATAVAVLPISCTKLRGFSGRYLVGHGKERGSVRSSQR